MVLLQQRCVARPHDTRTRSALEMTPNKFATGTGTVVVSGTNENILSTIPIRETGFQRPFYLAVAGGGKTLYEKIYMKNNNSSSTLSAASVVATGRNLVDIISWGLDVAMVLAFIGIVVPKLKLSSDWACAATAMLSTLLTYQWPNQIGLIFSSILAIIVGKFVNNIK